MNLIARTNICTDINMVRVVKKKPVFVLLELSNQMLSFTKLIIKQGLETKVLLLQRLGC